MRKHIGSGLIAAALVGVALALPAQSASADGAHGWNSHRYQHRHQYRHHYRDNRPRRSSRVFVVTPPVSFHVPRRTVTVVRSPAHASQPEGDQRLFIYPAQGQGEEQQARDRFECHHWAVSQSGFDPSAVGFVRAGHTVTTVTREREHIGLNPLTGAAGGAALGAVGGAVAGDAGAGAAIGAAVGATAGFLRLVTVGPRTTHEEVVVQHAGTDADATARSDYRRAIAACLDARGYTVR